jgi:predicted benzoate:H+ symporter BenE
MIPHCTIGYSQCLQTNFREANSIYLMSAILIVFIGLCGEIGRCVIFMA